MQISRRSVTFSEDDLKQNDAQEQTHETRKPMKTRRSRMQILDEIASVATDMSLEEMPSERRSRFV